MIAFVSEDLISRVRTPDMEFYLQFKGFNKFIFLNIGSVYQYAFPLKLLPNFTQDQYDSWQNGRNFDIEYANALLTDINKFSDLMKLIYPLYVFSDVAVIVVYNPRSEWLYDTLESISKFIQQRYGITSYLINDLNDFEFVERSDPNIFGITNLDHDKEVYVGIQQNPNYWETGSGREFDFLK